MYFNPSPLKSQKETTNWPAGLYSFLTLPTQSSSKGDKTIVQMVEIGVSHDKTWENDLIDGNNQSVYTF